MRDNMWQFSGVSVRGDNIFAKFAEWTVFRLGPPTQHQNHRIRRVSHLLSTFEAHVDIVGGPPPKCADALSDCDLFISSDPYLSVENEVLYVLDFKKSL